MVVNYKNRFSCPCCGYPTLEESSSYEICMLCKWQDDGQNDMNADKIFGGPNGSYSLTEARNNFMHYTTKDPPDKDGCLTSRDTKDEIYTKKELMKAFDAYSESSDINEMEKLCNKIENLERRLMVIRHERIKEFQKNIKFKEL